MARKRITRGMVLAAGFGLRMRPITDSLPKPLIPVGGRTMLDRALDHLADAGVETAVVNCHYLGEQVEAHVAARKPPPEISVSPETEILETGGGVLNALHKLDSDPFFVLNGDSVLVDGTLPTLGRMARQWDGRRMDALLLLYPTVRVPGYHGRGDFFMDPEGRLARRGPNQIAPFLFTGAQILHPRLFDGLEPGNFSLNLVYDRAIENGRLFGIRHDGAWFHVGTPAELEQVNEIFEKGFPAPAFL